MSRKVNIELNSRGGWAREVPVIPVGGETTVTIYRRSAFMGSGTYTVKTGGDEKKDSMAIIPLGWHTALPLWKEKLSDKEFAQYWADHMYRWAFSYTTVNVQNDLRIPNTGTMGVSNIEEQYLSAQHLTRPHIETVTEVKDHESLMPSGDGRVEANQGNNSVVFDVWGTLIVLKAVTTTIDSNTRGEIWVLNSQISDPVNQARTNIMETADEAIKTAEQVNKDFGWLLQSWVDSRINLGWMYRNLPDPTTYKTSY